MRGETAGCLVVISFSCKTKGEIFISPFYVQDEQYVTHAWMRKSDDVQDESFLELKGLITYG